MAKDVQVAIRMSSELREALRRAAAARRWSVASYLEFAATKQLENDGLVNRKAAPSEQ